MATPSSTKPTSPQRGDVIEFAFLWKHESDAGQSEAVKDRRCVIVSVLDEGRRIVVAPITGTEPAHAFKMPLRGGALGLERPSWIVTSDLNVTDWPGHYLRPAAAPDGAWWRYGRLSDTLKAKLADAVAAALRHNATAIVSRN
jgi:mRNA-degrading endonuclease toxin of MazEF toxin-antitoxin module